MAFTKFTQRQSVQQRVETVAEFTIMKDNVRRKESSVANVVSAITLLKFVVDRKFKQNETKSGGKHPQKPINPIDRAGNDTDSSDED
jgi:hypothetical protein